MHAVTYFRNCRSFERNSSLSPSSSPQNSPTGCSRSTFGGDSPEKSRMSSFFVAQQAVPSRVSRGGSPSRRVPVAKGRAESRKSHTSPPAEDLAPRRRPSLINRLKRYRIDQSMVLITVFDYITFET